MASIWCQLGPTWPQLGPTWLQLGTSDPPKVAYVLHFCYFFDFVVNLLWKLSWVAFFEPTWAQVDPTWPNMAPTWPQLCSNLAQVGPSWRQVGAKLGQVGPKLGQVGHKLGSSWHLEAMLQSSCHHLAVLTRLGAVLEATWPNLSRQRGRLGRQEAAASARLNPA